jgi:hypothetical protein
MKKQPHVQVGLRKLTDSWDALPLARRWQLFTLTLLFLTKNKLNPHRKAE